jgi:ADP-heptose:LPS heptosyltransferase
MMDKIREKVFNFRLNRQAKGSASMPNWADVRSVAIVYPNDNIQHIIKKIEAEDKEVVLFTMPEKQEVNWLTECPKADLQGVLNGRKYDILIDLTQQTSRTMQYMVMYARADFKVGRHNREGIYDMIIDTPAQETPDYLYEQIIKYIDMFGKR